MANVACYENARYARFEEKWIAFEWPVVWPLALLEQMLPGSNITPFVPFNNAGQPVRVRICPSVDEERIRQKSPFGLRFRITNHDGFAALDSLHRYDCRI